MGAIMSWRPTDDKVLIDRYLSGDLPAFSELVKRHQTLVYNLCYRIVGSVPEAEDLTQEIFIRLLDKIAGWRGEAKFTTWLYRVAVNHCRDYLRRRGPETAEAEEWPADPAPGPELLFESRETSDTVFAAIVSLPVDFRAVIFLRDIEGLSYDEISTVLNIELGTVKSRLARARARLTQILEPMAPVGHQRGRK